MTTTTTKTTRDLVELVVGVRELPAVPGRPRGQLPICSQCRRDVKPSGFAPVPYDDLWALRAAVALSPGVEPPWVHVADGTPRCALGTAEAVRRIGRALAGQAVRWGASATAAA